MRPFACALFILACCGTATAATKDIEITLTADKHDLKDTPVCVPLSVPAEFAKVPMTLLRDGGNQPIFGQLTAPSLMTENVAPAAGETRRDLCFIVPSLKKGDTLTLKATLGGPLPPISPRMMFFWDDKPGEYAQLREGPYPVLRYMYKALDTSTKESREETFKVYHHLYDPLSQRLVTKGPGGLYTHHRGIFYGFKTVTYDDNKVVDIWHCPVAYQAHDKFLATETGPVLGRHRVQISWHGKDKDIFAIEERELTVYRVPGGRLVEFASKLKSTKGTVKLDGDPQHAGFHFRADNEVNVKSKDQTYYVRPDGVGKPGKAGTRNWPENKEHVNLPWDAMCFVLGDQRYTMAYLDRPQNPKEARFSERDYGRFGSYFVAEVTEEKPLLVNYRLWLQEGEMKVADVAAKDADFVEPPTIKVK